MQSVYQKSDPAFLQLSAPMLAAISDGCPHRLFSQGQLIMNYGEECTGFWVIRAGQVATGRYSAAGDFKLFGLLGPAQLLGDLAFHAKLSRQVDAVAWSDCDLTWVDSRNWARLLREVDGLALVMLNSQARHLAASLDRIAEIDREPAVIRLARELLRHTDGVGALSLTQSQLAELIGVTRITIGAALRLLRAQGLITTRYGHVALPNREALARWVEEMQHEHRSRG